MDPTPALPAPRAATDPAPDSAETCGDDTVLQEFATAATRLAEAKAETIRWLLEARARSIPYRVLERRSGIPRSTLHEWGQP